MPAHERIAESSGAKLSRRSGSSTPASRAAACASVATLSQAPNTKVSSTSGPGKSMQSRMGTCRGSAAVPVQRAEHGEWRDRTCKALLDRLDAGDERRVDRSESAEEHADSSRTVNRHGVRRNEVSIVVRFVPTAGRLALCICATQAARARNEQKTSARLSVHD